MNIIIENEHEHELDSKHVLLELDTIRVGDIERTAYCVIENIPIQEIPIIENLKESHQTLIQEYRNKNWIKCNQIIDQLTGMWNGEVDTFYEELKSRINKFQQEDPGPTWSHILQK